MKRHILLLGLLIFSLSVFSAELTLSGHYCNENVIVDNPSVGSGFCVTEVLVNDQKGDVEILSNTFEIDLSLFNIKEGDAVKIIIRHQESCTPVILNPKALMPKCNNQIIGGRFDKKTIEVCWLGVKENCNLPYIVEQNKWDRWIELGKVESKVISDTNRYSYKVELHSDANVFRVRQVTPRGEEILSNEIKARSQVKEVTILLDKEGNNIMFSMETPYEIYNQKSELLKSGKAASVNISDLPKAVYIVCFDNAIVQVVKNK